MLVRCQDMPYRCVVGSSRHALPLPKRMAMLLPVQAGEPAEDDWRSG